MNRKGVVEQVKQIEKLACTLQKEVKKIFLIIQSNNKSIDAVVNTQSLKKIIEILENIDSLLEAIRGFKDFLERGERQVGF